MSHRRMGVLLWILAAAPVTFTAALVFHAWVAATLHRQMSRR